MLLEQKVLVKWTNTYKQYYESKGYKFTKEFDIFYVDVQDLLPNSNKDVLVQCDYCGLIFKRHYIYYIKNKDLNIINKDCCYNCIPDKRIESNLIKYGVEHVQQTDFVKQKILNSKYKNGTQSTSKQQNYLYEILGGELNYPVDNLSLDIAFLDEMIYMEYDGSGHDLSVVYNHISERDFKKQQIKRWYYLNSKNWKEIRLISKKDILPKNNMIIHLFNIAKEYLKTGHSWFEIDIDNNRLKCSQYEIDYDFGQLIKI